MSPPTLVNIGQIGISNDVFKFDERVERLLRLHSGAPARQLTRLKLAIAVVTGSDGVVLMSLERKLIEEPTIIVTQVKKWYGLDHQMAVDLTEIIILNYLKILYEQ